MADKLSENAAFVDTVDKSDDSIIEKLTTDSTLDSGRLEIVVTYQTDVDGEIERFFSSAESFITTEVKDVT